MFTCLSFTHLSSIFIRLFLCPSLELDPIYRFVVDSSQMTSSNLDWFEVLKATNSDRSLYSEPLRVKNITMLLSLGVRIKYGHTNTSRKMGHFDIQAWHKNNLCWSFELALKLRAPCNIYYMCRSCVISRCRSKDTTLNMIFSVWLYWVLLPPYHAQHKFSILW
jgi:hypothetical protein